MIPIISYDNNKVEINIQKRPCLIVDDGRGLIVGQDNRNYHILKLTTQNDSYNRKIINNWRYLGLKKKSYIRIELPIKLEEEQLIYKITEFPINQLISIYSDIYNIINISALEKIKNNYNNFIYNSH